jgi:hypothetical protein
MATTPKNDDKAAKVDDLGASEVQARFDEANAKGYFGETPDETPNENYTLSGVTSGKPTPETERGKK